MVVAASLGGAKLTGIDCNFACYIILYPMSACQMFVDVVIQCVAIIEIIGL
jgi:hypothetical protein